ncbi:MAG: 50S ribosomal protein L10 [Candidatus Taylorbacteria bacterium RIFCSPLOWO2_12_FULL_44_15c]|uniref:Large ribosomal subunit protein uL10 n=1 Tax=Candidatus Taylorbacteria bacterium RIFCSPLOWO2_12_FULL_44_15c TaxID=1802333 RepID=A0A1G2P926_9BACT|nr:MAG: 50S ribosomal protein L10 [Candidatus Taylorbacteria bacterium RIFCSPLOWO2_02_FULL_44_35]OHA44102.1 MAG: 50S ribosomal protein L10 [Candidatus Taylorbacteria bacterium RIFCSPLOWO2_12_FULL_44_15c]
MAKTKAQKKASLATIAKLIKDVKDAGSVALVKFSGLTVADATNFRRKLRAESVNYLVTKKTLAKKALTESGVAGEVPALDGQIGLAWGADQIAPARGVYEFQKQSEKKVELLGGIFEGRFMNCQEMSSIAAIPSRQTLYAQLVNVINSPIQGLVMILDGMAKKKVV